MTPLDLSGVPHDRPIEVLNFEDDPADALIVERALGKVFLMNFEWRTASGGCEKKLSMWHWWI